MEQETPAAKICRNRVFACPEAPPTGEDCTKEGKGGRHRNSRRIKKLPERRKTKIEGRGKTEDAEAAGKTGAEEERAEEETEKGVTENVGAGDEATDNPEENLEQKGKKVHRIWPPSIILKTYPT